MRKSKDIFILLFLILAAVVIGGFIAQLTSGISALKWLTYGEAISFNYGNLNPLIDLGIFKFNFGFQLNVNILQIVLICISLLIYRKVK